jgi:hypothetical protein
VAYVESRLDESCLKSGNFKRPHELPDQHIIETGENTPKEEQRRAQKK